MCVHVVVCVQAHMCQCVCMWRRPKVDVRTHSHLLFHFVRWVRISQSNPELGFYGRSLWTCLLWGSCLCLLRLKLQVSFWRSELCSSGFLSKPET